MEEPATQRQRVGSGSESGVGAAHGSVVQSEPVAVGAHDPAEKLSNGHHSDSPASDQHGQSSGAGDSVYGPSEPGPDAWDADMEAPDDEDWCVFSCKVPLLRIVCHATGLNGALALHLDFPSLFCLLIFFSDNARRDLEGGECSSSGGFGDESGNSSDAQSPPDWGGGRQPQDSDSAEDDADRIWTKTSIRSKPPPKLDLQTVHRLRCVWCVLCLTGPPLKIEVILRGTLILRQGKALQVIRGCGLCQHAQ